VLMEAVERFRARSCAVSTGFALQWVAKLKPAPVPDWRRAVLEFNVGIEEGHQFAKESMPAELAGLREDWKASFGRELPEHEAIKALNEPAGRAVMRTGAGAPAISVLGWDFWSAQHQRHFCQSIRATNRFYRDVWGVDEFREVQKFAKLNFADLTLFPLLERELSEDAHDLADINRRVAALIASHPELVDFSEWAGLNNASGPLPALELESPGSWYNPQLPFGTTYGYSQRAFAIYLPFAQDAWWDALLALAPDDYNIRSGRIWRAYGDTHSAQSLAAIKEAFSRLQSYNLRALVQIADAQKAGSPSDYPETMQRICDIDPDYYFEFGRWYVDQKNDEKAAAAFQKGVDLAGSEVLIANQSAWYVNYLEDHGQSDRALAIAKRGAEAYSSAGLETMARLKERRGQLKEAEEYFEKIDERYHVSSGLAAFYDRQRASDPAYEKKAASAQRTAFPEGMKKVSIADFQEPPQAGVVSTSYTQSMAAAGLRQGDVLVALNGYQVTTGAQYYHVRDLGLRKDLQIIAWNGGVYREVIANPPNGRFGTDFVEYRKP
jgi:tetratricopeptide (TPR) repeat protein